MLREVKLTFLARLFLCLLSASLLVLSFPCFNLEWLAWLAFLPALLAVENTSRGKAFLLFYIFGVFFWLGVIYWLVHVTLPGMLILVLYLSLYFGLFGLLISPSLLATTYYLLAIPSLWVLLEYLRSQLLTGFPWALLGYSQYLNLPLIQIADITGVWGVSFLVILVNISLFYLLRGKQRYIIFTASLFIVVLVYGFFKIVHLESDLGKEKARVAVVQGNIAQELKWDPRYKDFILRWHLNLSAEAAISKPDLIIWPEASLPVVLEEETGYYEKASSFAREIKTPLLFGAVTFNKGSYYNSALLVSAGGELLQQYHKLHLVPFGEYIPLRKVFAFLETIVPIGDIAAGREYTVFVLPGIHQAPEMRFSVLVCFEDLFPGLSRRFIRDGAQFLVNITNDAWFKRTSSPYQHLSASVLRAVENRVCLIRAANTGISGFIAPSGRIISLVADKEGRNIFIPGYNIADITVCRGSPGFYTSHGDIFVVVFLFFVLCGMILPLAKKPKLLNKKYV